MSLLDTRQAIAAALEVAIGNLAQSGTHGGRFDLAELRRWANRSPCVLSACLGVQGVDLEGGTQPVANARWAAYVITRGDHIEKRDAQAVAIVETVLATVPGNDWGETDTHNPKSIRADNLYNSALDKVGIALWAVTWDQRLDLSTVALSSLSDWDTFYTDYEIGDDDSTTDTTTMEQD